MYTLKIKQQGTLINEKIFYTKQEIDEYFESYQVGNKILISNEWHIILKKRKGHFKWVFVVQS